MKKSTILKLVLSAVIGTSCLTANAQVFTGLLGNSTSMTASNNSDNQLSPALDQKNFFTAGMRIPFNPKGTVYFAAQATGTFDLFLLDSQPEISFGLDLDLFKMNASFQTRDKKAALLSIGRFPVTDITGIIYSQSVDGLLLQLKTQRFSSTYSLAYTGLLNGLNICELDSNGLPATPGAAVMLEDYAIYQFGSPYLIATGSFSAPYLFANQTVGLELFGVAGLPGINVSQVDDPFRLYATLYINGPVTRFMFYDLTSTVETFGAFQKLANLSTFHLSIYPGFLSSSITLGATYASGAQAGEDGILTSFVPFTKLTAVNSKDELNFSAVSKASFDFSCKPISDLWLNIGYAADFKNPETEFTYFGSEINLKGIYQIFTDLQVNLGASVFIGANPADNKYAASLNAVISF